MPAPSTIDEFLDLVRKSAVVEEKRLTTLLDRLRAEGPLPAVPLKFAEKLVGVGVITRFQAEQLLQGKWRRFTLGKYRVLERLGAGGMGSVYLCEHMVMRRRVAVKVLPTAKAEDSSSLERFYREARAVAALDHPNIVRAYDIDKDDNLHFLVMEHVDGASLQEIVRRAGPMDILRTCHYIYQAALGLQHAHEKATLVHRDIKPGNILVDRNGIVKILDMGLARFFKDEEDQLTKKYDENILGTADYLAPEQALDSHEVDIRADIYSLGATFYYCLTGRTPFQDGSVAQKLIWHQTRAPKPIRSLRPEVPEEIVAVVDRMMAKDKNVRFQSPLEVADALAPWTRTPIAPPPDSEMPQLSLAATRGLNESSASSPSSRNASDSASGSRNKVWQINAGNATQPTAKASATAADSRPPVPIIAPPQSRSTPSRAPSLEPPPKSPAPSSPVPVPRVQAPAVPASGRVIVSAPPKTTPPSGIDVRVNGAARATQASSQSATLSESVEEVSDESDDATFREVGSRRTPISSRRQPATTQRISRLGWIVIAAAVIVGLPFLIWAIYLLVGSSGADKAGKSSGRKPIRVNTREGFRSALAHARRGDHILIDGDIEDYDLSIEHDKIGLTIEAEPNVVLKCPPSAPRDANVLLIGSTTNVTLKGLTIDGGGTTQALVVLFGKCPGTRLENLRLRNYAGCGLLISSCMGDGEHPVQVRNLEVQTSAATQGIRFDILPRAVVEQNRFITFEKIRFEGPGKKWFAAKDQYVDQTTVKLPDGQKLEPAP